MLEMASIANPVAVRKGLDSNDDFEGIPRVLLHVQGHIQNHFYILKNQKQ